MSGDMGEEDESWEEREIHCWTGAYRFKYLLGMYMKPELTRVKGMKVWRYVEREDSKGINKTPKRHLGYFPQISTLEAKIYGEEEPRLP